MFLGEKTSRNRGCRRHTIHVFALDPPFSHSNRDGEPESSDGSQKQVCLGRYTTDTGSITSKVRDVK